MSNTILKIVPKQEIVAPFLSDMQGESLIQNYEILNRLSKLQEDVVKKFNIDKFLCRENTSLSLDYQLSELAIDAGLTIEYLNRLRRLFFVTHDLLDNFRDDLAITAMVQTTDTDVIDLFIKGRHKALKGTFALMLRSQGNAKIRWRSESDRQYFTAYKAGRGHQRWNALDRCGDKLATVMNLKKAKSPLLGESRKERDQTIIKAVVLCGGTTIYQDDREHIAEFNRAEVLRVYNGSLFFLVEQQNLEKFLY